jgi:hypothetical protein
MTGVENPSHERTHAPQQIAASFHHLVGEREGDVAATVAHNALKGTV